MMASISSRIEMNRVNDTMEMAVYMIYDACETDARQNVLDENDVMNVLEHPRLARPQVFFTIYISLVAYATEAPNPVQLPHPHSIVSLETPTTTPPKQGKTFCKVESPRM